MSVNSFKLEGHSALHKVFLKQKFLDPYNNRPFQWGDEVVFCENCQQPFLKNSWALYGRQHCGQSNTLSEFPDFSQVEPVKEKVRVADPPLAPSKERNNRVPWMPLLAVIALLMATTAIFWSEIQDRLKIYNSTNNLPPQQVITPAVVSPLIDSTNLVTPSGEEVSITVNTDEITNGTTSKKIIETPSKPIYKHTTLNTRREPAFQEPSNLLDFWTILSNDNINHATRKKYQRQMINEYFADGEAVVRVVKGSRTVGIETVEDFSEAMITSPSLTILEISPTRKEGGKIRECIVKTGIK